MLNAPYIRSAQFHSLLTPPIRISISTLHTYFRPQCIVKPACARRPTPSSMQCRLLNLLITSKASTTLGMQKVISFELYKPPSLEICEHKVNLLERHGTNRFIAKDISFKDLYDQHIKPGQLLYFAHDLPGKLGDKYSQLEAQNIPASYRDFAITKAGSRFVKISAPQKGNQLGALKVLMINLASPIDYVMMQLDKAYQFVDNGCQVEIRMRMRDQKESKAEQLKPGPAHVWPWVHTHFPHLRPDFILRAMPEGSQFLIQPVSNGRHVQFVIAKPTKQMPSTDLTNRLFRVKTAVLKSIQEERQGQLPSATRKKLVQEGLTRYDRAKGLPHVEFSQNKSIKSQIRNNRRREVDVFGKGDAILEKKKGGRDSRRGKQSSVGRGDDESDGRRSEQVSEGMVRVSNGSGDGESAT